MLAYSSTKQSVMVSESKRQTSRDDPMDVDALSKGKSKREMQERPCWLRKGQQRPEPDEQRQVLGTGASLDTTPATAERSGQETKEAARAKEVKERRAKAKAS